MTNMPNIWNVYERKGKKDKKGVEFAVVEIAAIVIKWEIGSVYVMSGIMWEGGSMVR